MNKSALIIINAQNGMLPELNPVFGAEVLLLNLLKLIKKARTSNSPIFYIQHNGPEGSSLEYGTPGWEIHSELTPLKSDIIIQKTTPDSFHRTNLEEELKKQNITHLIITGIQSEACVDTTCRRAFSMDYEVTFVTDAHSTWDTEELTAQQIINHHNDILMWFAETKGTDEVEFQ